MEHIGILQGMRLDVMIGVPRRRRNWNISSQTKMAVTKATLSTMAAMAPAESPFVAGDVLPTRPNNNLSVNTKNN